jgi:hypothetical protein
MMVGRRLLGDDQLRRRCLEPDRIVLRPVLSGIVRQNNGPSGAGMGISIASLKKARHAGMKAGTGSKSEVRFHPGRILVSHRLFAVLSERQRRELVRTHLGGGWNESLRVKNERAVREGGHVLSECLINDKNGRRIMRLASLLHDVDRHLHLDHRSGWFPRTGGYCIPRPRARTRLSVGTVRARHLVSASGLVESEAIAVYASTEMVMPAYLPGTAPIATPDQIILVLGAFRGDVWMMDLDPHSTKVADNRR